MSNFPDIFNQNQAPQDDINLKDLLYRYLSYWPWYVLCVVLFMATGYIYLKYQPNIYEANASVLIDSKPNNPFSDMRGSASMVFIQKDALEDEIQIMKSLPVLTKTAKALNLNIQLSYKAKLTKRTLEIYDNAPIAIEVLSDNQLYQSVNFKFKHQDPTSFQLTFGEDDSSTTHKYNQQIKVNEELSVIIKNTSHAGNKNLLKEEISVSISNLENAAFGLVGQIKAEPASKQSSSIFLSMRSTNFQKAKDVLDEVCRQYFDNSVNHKKQSLSNTAEFIKERIILLDDELRSIETEIKEYKQQNRLTDIVTESQFFSSNIEKINDKTFDVEMQLNLLNAINQRLMSNENEVLPINQGVSDAGINASIAKYNELAMSLKNLSENLTPLNPERLATERFLKEAKKSILDGLQNQKRLLELTLRGIKAEGNLVDQKVRSIPKIENEMRDIQRRQQTKEALFLYLLQKREEVAITMTTLVPNAKTINYAHGIAVPVAPKKPIILLAFLIAALLLPTAVIYLRDLLDTKIHTIEQLEKISTIPNMGLIPSYNTENRVLLDLNDRSSTSEAIRLLLTNTEFILSDNHACKTILLTSTFSGEGKTFLAANVASFLAHSGKKTMLLGFDLRAPKINEFFEYKNTLGITHFIKDLKVNIEDVIINIPGYDNKLNVIHAGVTVPNFVELLKNSRIEELFVYLKKEYDYLVIDSAPVGLVSDTLNLAKYIDLSLFVFRAHQFEKSDVVVSNKLFKENKLKQLYSVLNDVDFSKKSYGYYYGYGYGYGRAYGYGYGYTQEKEKINKLNPFSKNFWKHWFKR